MDFKAFTSAITQISEEKGLMQDKVLEIIEQALASAYKKEYGEKGQVVKAVLDLETGKTDFYRILLVVDPTLVYMDEDQITEFGLTKAEAKKFLKKEEEEEVDQEGKRAKFNTEKHILITEAKKENEDIKVGDEIKTHLEQKEDFGRIAAQTAKQVILQKIREAEKENVLSEFKDREGEIVSGIIQRIDGKNIYFDLGRGIGVLPREEQVRGEFYKEGQRLKLYLLKVEITPKGPNVILSRAYPKFISKLFELEVPEINGGQVEIKSIAREAGYRTKIAVESKAEGVDAIGAMVGQRGVRVAAVMSELGGEKIDIIEYSSDPAQFIINSLSPAKTSEVEIKPKNTALAVVPEDQLSLAIGKDGQNVRLAAKLTGWRIDVRSENQGEEDIISSDTKINNEEE
ncbi:MAG TPA: transcription termination factor NusA [Candidatus Pacearchaeota archaeon]|nr:transcription termination factor NusA [Candidatus Pacearchaeota archaeon]